MGCKTQKGSWPQGDVPMYKMQHNMVENILKNLPKNIFLVEKYLSC